MVAFSDVNLAPFSEFSRYLTGSRASIKVNNRLFGFAFGVTFNIETVQDEIWTIDDWTPYELAPNKVKVHGTLSMFHIPGKGPTKELVQPTVLSFLFHKYITIRIEDQLTANKIFETKRAQITSRRQSVNAGEMSTIELKWKAIGFRDQMVPFWPNQYDGSSENLSNSGFSLSNVFN